MPQPTILPLDLATAKDRDFENLALSHRSRSSSAWTASCTMPSHSTQLARSIIKGSTNG